MHPGATIEMAPPPEPNFSMKSRSVPKLLDQVEAWHRHLNREEKSAEGQWNKSDIADFFYQEGDTENGGFGNGTVGKKGPKTPPETQEFMTATLCLVGEKYLESELSLADAVDIINKAKENNTILLTTEKDYLRIDDNYKKNINFLKIAIEIENRNQFIEEIKKVI